MYNYLSLVYVFAFIYGALVGSFANVLIIRLPKNENWIIDSSHCIKCGHKIKWWMNIPLLSFFLLRGKCYFCKKNISLQYPLVELLCAVKAVALAYFYIEDLELFTFLNFLHMDLILVLLIVHFFIDVKHQILPDIINILLLILGLLYVYKLDDWKPNLIGALVGFLGPLLITYLFFQIRGQVGLGGGDIKLFGVIGLFLGWQGIIQTLLYSSVLGIVVAGALIALGKLKRQDPFAFGPSIIIIFVIQLYLPGLLP